MVPFHIAGHIIYLNFYKHLFFDLIFSICHNIIMQCLHVNALNVFFDGIQTEPVEIAVVGCGCSFATEPVAEISHRWSIPQVHNIVIELKHVAIIL